ncbi:CAMK family protein kinase [Histomonas meleagridis]|uniref:CAMK family protein kinase n=1 Tax=Histomonas meleagridis TaxID=135588 RepID=UPI003559CB18|nr:CAMK family protein kinase [Histomonas meleagridis]KAH0803108.1 CAMK family protein kinase [Histomonas meleagridis]
MGCAPSKLEKIEAPKHSAQQESTNTKPDDTDNSNTDEEEDSDYTNYSEAETISFQTFISGALGRPLLFEYEFKKSIGHGSQSEVFLVENVETNVQYAAKVYDKFFLYRNNLSDSEPPINKLIREIQIMSTLNHPNCMNLIEVLDDDCTNSIILILPLAQSFLLPQRSKVSPIPEPICKLYFFQIASGLEHIHSHNYIHHDIKPENILLFPDGRIAITDFSTSIILDSSDGILEDTDGTPAFFSPEQCTGQSYRGKPADIWSCGVSLYMMLYGKLPFFDISEEGFFLSHLFNIAKQIQYNDVTFNENVNVSEDAKDLILHCLDKNPESRYTIEQVLSHKWLSACYEDEEILRIEGDFLYKKK